VVPCFWACVLACLMCLVCLVCLLGGPDGGGQRSGQLGPVNARHCLQVEVQCAQRRQCCGMVVLEPKRAKLWVHGEGGGSGVRPGTRRRNVHLSSLILGLLPQYRTLVAHEGAHAQGLQWSFLWTRRESPGGPLAVRDPLAILPPTLHAACRPASVLWVDAFDVPVL
jgi:hypothetical protein